ncbi:unnamed protein product [Sphagnum jensenii]|uniref:Uncharacterized protein n=2 Tax=Sphagnum jensenii TaxID=128206 RepID=A0ABP0WP37_9BRYO
MGRDSSFAMTGKRSRVVEDEIYYDNYHVHKLYLTEVMASSLNGLKVGESESCTQRASPPLPENMVSPAQTEAGALSRSASSFPSHGYSLPAHLPSICRGQGDQMPKPFEFWVWLV